MPIGVIFGTILALRRASEADQTERAKLIGVIHRGLSIHPEQHAASDLSPRVGSPRVFSFRNVEQNETQGKGRRAEGLTYLHARP